MTPDERLKARITAMTNTELQATWNALRARQIPRDEALVLNPRIMTEMHQRGMPTS